MTIATILPEARTVFTDTNNNPLAGGFVYMYVPPNTMTPKTTWQDAAGATPNANPIVLDGNGSCLLYGSGQYLQEVYDSNMNLIYTGLTQDVYGLLVNGNNVFTGTNTFSGTVSFANNFVIPPNSVTNAMLLNMAANTVKANATASLASPTDFALTTGTVLGRAAGNIAALAPTAVLDVIGSTQGDVLYRSATAWTALAPGTAGQFLQTGGAAANPLWAAAGAISFLGSASASNSAALNLTSLISSSFNDYLITFDNIIPVASVADLNMAASLNNGSTWDTTNWGFAAVRTKSSATVIGIGLANTIPVLGQGMGDTSTLGLSGFLWAFNLNSTAVQKFFVYQTGYYDDAGPDLLNGITGTSIWQVTASTCNALQFLMSTGNISSGVVKMYGLTI